MTDSSPPSSRASDTSASRWLSLAVALATLGLVAMSIDCRVSIWCLADGLPGDLRRPLDIAEGLGHGFGVLLVLVAIFVLDPARRWALPRLATTAFGAGIAANIFKLLVARTRPRAFDFQGGVWDTFQGLFPLGLQGSANQSFPSAHTATIVGLAFALTWLYPRGRWFFATLVVLVACQRIESAAHYLSDTLFAAALGCLMAVVFLKVGPICRWFDCKEARWKTSWAGRATS